MKLKTHIMLRFGILLLILLAISTASYYGIQKLNKEYENAITLQTPELQNLEIIKTNAEKIEPTIINLETLQKGNSAKEKTELLAITEKIKDNLKEYPHQEEPQVIELKKQIDSLVVYSVEYIKLKESETAFEQINNKRKQLRETEIKIINMMNQLVQHEQTRAITKFQKTQETLINSTILTIIITTTLIIVLAITTSNQISKPLNKISETINEISKGNLHAKIQTETEINEINALEDSLNRVTASLKIAVEKVGIKKSEIMTETQKKSQDFLEIFKKNFENSPTSMMLAEYKQGKPTIVDVNKKFTEYYGYTEKEAKGKMPNLLKSGKQNKKFYKEMWTALLDPELAYWTGEVINKTKKGKLIKVMLTINTMFDENENPKYFIANHIKIGD